VLVLVLDMVLVVFCCWCRLVVGRCRLFGFRQSSSCILDTLAVLSFDNDLVVMMR
jgi:hypothetical protein